MRRGVKQIVDHQMLRFTMVGALNSAFAFVLFGGLLLVLGGRLHYVMILMLTHVLAVLEAYVLQRWLVFRVTGHWWRDLARFWSVYLVALPINVLALTLLVEIARVPVLPAQAIVMAALAMGTFVAHRRFTFRRTATHRRGDRTLSSISRREGGTVGA